ncbi:radical SAM protein [Streptomyces sp. NPDC059455]|uniref:radical SAM protein n=1 Tax=Streptomyces sp. NPDC059455 TaxID=3346837 RepID=UPI0036CA58B8
MGRDDWLHVLDQAAECGVRRVQLIGGEPTLYPDSLLLADRALSLGLGVEIYSNLVRVTEAWWALLRRDGMSLAASYYSDTPEEHNEVTGRPSHARTLANIKKAVALGIPLRIGRRMARPGIRGRGCPPVGLHTSLARSAWSGRPR